MSRRLLLHCCLLLLALPVLAAPRVVKEWTFDTGDEGWKAANHISDLKTNAGNLEGRLNDWDPFIISPQFEIPATPWQVVEFRLKTDCGGDGEIFWTNTTKTEYGGFSPGKETRFTVIGDGQWHDYRLAPFWQGEGKIILLRLDFAAARGGGKSFAVDYIRIVDPGAAAPVTTSDWDLSKGAGGFTGAGGLSLTPGAGGLAFRADGPECQLLSPPLKLNVDNTYNLHLELTANNAAGGAIVWATQAASGLKRQPFTIRGDGRRHYYNFDLSSSSAWSGDVLLLGLALPAGAAGTLHRMCVSDRPLGPADVEVAGLHLDAALPRAGQDIPLLLTLRNHGGADASGLTLGEVKLPAGLQLKSPALGAALPAVPATDTVNVTLLVHAQTAAEGQARVALAGAGAPAGSATCDLKVTPALNLPKATYVPEPQPIQTTCEIGAFYFPGWQAASKWDPVRRVAPVRKPVLGWYDEGNPECVDWQIKWAVEHGISYFMVDWYWSAGSKHLDHWLAAYEKARYRKYLKWCMMWANHNAPNTHSMADQANVTKFWIDNYFKMPEYYRIDDMPVVMIWAPGNLRRDLGGSEGAKKALDLSQQMAREAGYKGIYFIAMGGEDIGAKSLEELKSEGYSMTSVYHYMGHGGRAANPMRFTFDKVADSSLEHWQKRLATGVLPSLPDLSTGWDASPWHGENTVIITGRTVPLFRRICEDAKRFAEANGIKRLALGPLNEWGEGSYLEPCQEFGFDMYNQVREVFGKNVGPCKEDYGPADVGLGPYDFKDMDVPARSAWDFSDGAQGWGPMMGVKDFTAKDGTISFVTSSSDPALQIIMQGLAASKAPKLTIRMKVEGPAGTDGAQLFWTTGSGHTEGASIKFDTTIDGQWHDYVLDLAGTGRYRGIIRGLRFDPASKPDLRITIDEVKFE